MRDAGCMVDVYVQNEEGELISYDRDGIPYTLQLWLEGRECDPRSKGRNFDGSKNAGRNP